MNTPKSIPAEFSQWLNTPQILKKSEQEEKAKKSAEKEIEERSRLLINLENDRREIKKRIKQNIRWEYELLGLPDFYNDVEKIVDRIYEKEKMGK